MSIQYKTVNRREDFDTLDNGDLIRAVVKGETRTLMYFGNNQARFRFVEFPNDLTQVPKVYTIVTISGDRLIISSEGTNLGDSIISYIANENNPNFNQIRGLVERIRTNLVISK